MKKVKIPDLDYIKVFSPEERKAAKCMVKVEVPKEMLELLNSYSTVSKEYFNTRIIWPPLPKGFISQNQQKGGTFFST